MAKIIIHLSQENIASLLLNKDITVGSNSGNTQLAVDIATDDVQISFLDLIEEKIATTKQDCSYRTSETYIATLIKLRLFLKDKDLMINEVTPELMESFQRWLKKQHLAMNTISFHMRKLRAVYNKAVDRGLTNDLRPFRDVYTGMAKTQKRAIAIDDIKRMKSLELDDPMDAYARDLFLFSFYTRGMAFVDIAYLRKSDVNDGVLTYQRKKTGQLLTMRWEPSMQEIAERYPSKTGFYLLPIIHSCNGKERNQYRHIQALVNESLKTVGKMAGLGQKLTMYVARHSWATIARQMGVPINVISYGMGHSNEKTTEIYLKSLDTNIIDEANHKILTELDLE